MYRSLYQSLLKWKDSPTRMPLMLYGARQVGKTYLLKEFGHREFDNLVYFNCYHNNDIKTLFESDKDVSRIIRGLSALSQEEINPGRTLIFLDEAQEVPNVISSLKYFCEDAREYHVAVAGSLLGVLNLEGASFPTGKIDIMHLFPMTFSEFLEAKGNSRLLKLLEPELLISSHDFANTYQELLRQYYFVGGMPHAVEEFITTGNVNSVRTIQNNILTAYEADIAKHAGKDAVKVRSVFEAIPSQLAKENSRFIFGALKSGARAADYERAVQWLIYAGLVYKVPDLSKVSMPLLFYIERNKYKLYLLDVGLLGAMTKTPPSHILIGNNIFSEFKGAFTENYVLTQLMTLNDSVIAYFTKEKSSLEIDFILQYDDKLFPIEVKAEVNVKSKSLSQFIKIDNKDSGLRGYRVSMKGFEIQDWLTNIPLYAVLPFFKGSTNNL